MCKAFIRLWFTTIFTVGIILASAGCNWNSGSDQNQQERDEKTREEAAKATEKLKPTIEDAGRVLGRAAERASEDARAAAQGVHQGWERGSHKPVDLNSATENELMELSGISRRDARKIIEGRPYRDKRDLVNNRILTHAAYAKIQDQITVK